MEDAAVVRLINAILTDAVKRGASDIHFECFEHEIRVRYRVEGALDRRRRAGVVTAPPAGRLSSTNARRLVDSNPVP